MDVSELWALTLRQAADGLARRDFSSAELLEATLERLEETEPAVHAYVTLMEETARGRAAAADEELREGRWRGPLHGIPVGVKDLCYTKGVRTEAGSRVLEGFVPDHDATVVLRLKEAGAVIVGKTVTHEFAYGQDIPATRNPWDLDCYPGGSSAGSGVSVAVGSAFAAIGTDTGGSVRVPASVNGVVGLKPTYGRVSKHGVIPMSPTLDTVGPLARTAEDCALVLGVIAGHDPADSGSVPEAVPDFASALSQGVDGLRLGLDREHFLSDRVVPEVRAACEAAIEELRSVGADVVEVRLPELAHASPAGMPVLLADTSEWHRHFLRTRGDRYVPATRLMLELGEMVLGAQYVTAQRSRAWLRDRVRNSFDMHRLDGLVGPTLPTPTMPLEQLSVDLTGGGETKLSAFLRHCFAGNVVGIPALSFPCGFSSEGLPIGLQVYGRPFEESKLFRVAHAYQQVSDWHQRRPQPQLKAGVR
ncbi:MAG: Asp-tRNA(Asn)/Glu-tRNA(Gln) amidotransferase GatCAB subunit A [Candidatus Dormibacteraeota bacterium]|uniref:Asp-tRNA(Asn)/Glu-tRNA(Gln) amidotransferase GatCAB subunit A n=1 Tax=Candidatus Nephthysia bennettiae TaxID=3127016 RepID=A0A934K285_9BACT|nr:Asp-tRNA(Asn)/Glu-tRNA(Gln) amidotransferase GatCAB subunit A [Candidatus Dormibacteraeota bacterium]MBJ7614223.1 Asp-tRNA(Asn)/Glu-tRNA(Gln) amidotransferase GatCAB subunit A [Candidatus Dormibacteraeota bacterium]